MNVLMFENWLRDEGFPEDQRKSILNRCVRICRAEGDMDRAWEADHCRQMLERFVYTANDERHNMAKRHSVPIDGNVRSGTASLLDTVRKFVMFKLGAHRGGNNRQNRARRQLIIHQESYERIFRRFNINEDALLDFGMRESIFATPESALENWNMLKDRLLNGDEISIRPDRGSCTAMWHDLYEFLFGANVVQDSDGNTIPTRALAMATGYTTRDDPGCIRLDNYVLSHIFDERTMNPMLFGAVCNFAFTPTFFDPFTGTAKGGFAARFKRAFRNYARELFVETYSAYKDFVQEYQVLERIEDFNPANVEGVALRRFKKRAIKQWTPEFLIP